ncbi:hypothetical protein SKAU_G00269930 [Synaphobranchus kaupii]|uniref:Ig-like domain-containing protein n=1 Tax=Synaphobranchus kaupii TaxID=118154 RepID=A0A9Q1IQG5_SYNKA|nr:hypothetical protein SKAU_G00269930 [Synaphobranchus kaupii]
MHKDVDVYNVLSTKGKTAAVRQGVVAVICSSREEWSSAPKLKRLKSQLVDEGSKLTVKCEASGNPPPSYRWYKDGSELKKSKEIKIKSGMKNSRVQINRARLEDSGNYTCVAENLLGKENSTGTINVQSTEQQGKQPGNKTAKSSISADGCRMNSTFSLNTRKGDCWLSVKHSANETVDGREAREKTFMNGRWQVDSAVNCPLFAIIGNYGWQMSASLRINVCCFKEGELGNVVQDDMRILQ